MDRELEPFAPVIDLFLCGKLPKLSHARHLAIARVMRRLPHGRELMHLGLRITAIRRGVPEKYSREITDHYWDRLEDGLPAIEHFADVLR